MSNIVNQPAPRRSRRAAVIAFAGLWCLGGALRAAPAEFRAQWADGFNTPLLSSSSTAQLQTCIDNLRAAHSNVLLPEIRLNTDANYIPHPAWYPNLNGISGLGSLLSNGVRVNCDLDSDPEPRINNSYDALGTLLQKAHDTTSGKQRIDIWAWLVSFRTGTKLRTAHPTWLTQQKSTTDNTLTVINDFDPGHPGSEQQLYNVCMDLVNNYDIDGFNFDYIRFTDASNGYNAVSLARFRAQNGLASTYIPAYNNALWKQWRRDQVTNTVRKIYLNAIAVKPNIKITSDNIPWGAGPTKPAASDTNWLNTWKTNYQSTSDAYNAVYQDWRSWLEEGILDLAIPMNYNSACDVEESYFQNWTDFEKDVQFKKAADGTIYQNRQVLVGPGTYLNTLSDAIYQMKLSRSASTYRGKTASGQCMYVYDNPYADACRGNVVVDPAGMATALNSMVVSGFDGQPMYPDQAALPALLRQTNGKGDIKGTITDPNTPAPGWVDGATVTLKNASLQTVATIKSDGTGFYGFVDVAPGTYTLNVTANTLPVRSATVTVAAYQVSTVDLAMSAPIATHLVFTASPTAVEQNVSFATQPVVAAQDAGGQTVSTFTGPITVAIEAGTGTGGAHLLGTTTINAVNGIAAFSGLGIDTVGSGYVLQAAGGSLAGAAGAAFDVSPVAGHLAFAAQPAGGTSNIPFATQPVVSVLDSANNLIAGYSGTVTLSLTPATGPAGANLLGATTVSLINGTATFSGIAIDRYGYGYQLRAAISGLASADTLPFDLGRRTTRVSPGGSDANDGTTWSGARKTLTAAIDNSGPGDEIWAAAGAYAENITLKDVVGVFGGFAGTETVREDRRPSTNTTIIDGGGIGPVVSATSVSADTTLDGFTVRNGGGADGGGVWLSNASPVISNNVITGSTVTGLGAGVYVDGGSPTISGNSISTNHGDSGAGIYIEDGSNATVTANVITGNTASDTGGGIACSNAAPDIAGNTVTSNAAGHGGGIAILDGSGPLLAGNLVAGNTASDGGGILSTGSSPDIRESVVRDNTATAGGGLSLEDFGGSVTSTTVVSNTGSGIAVTGASYPILANDIVSGNTGGLSAGPTSAVTVDHCDVFGNGTDYTGMADPTGTSGNLHADPLFVNAAANDYHIQPASPCHDAGSDDYLNAGETDFDGALRPQGRHTDIGAYEAPGIAPYTLADATYALTVAAGLVASTPDDAAQFNVIGQPRITLDDAALILRKVTGLAANP